MGDLMGYYIRGGGGGTSDSAPQSPSYAFQPQPYRGQFQQLFVMKSITGRILQYTANWKRFVWEH